MKIGIIGTRKRNTITDYNIVREAFFDVYHKRDVIVSGHCAKGGDAFAEKIAFDYGIPIIIYPPIKKALFKYINKDPEKHNYVKELFARNKLIAEESDFLIACVVDPHEVLEDIYKRQTGGSEDTIRKFLGKLGYHKFHSDGDIPIRDDMLEKVKIC
jgi:hypothetical protein